MKSKIAFIIVVAIMLVWASITLMQQHVILSKIDKQLQQTQKMNATIDETLRPLTSGELKL